MGVEDGILRIGDARAGGGFSPLKRRERWPVVLGVALHSVLQGEHIRHLLQESALSVARIPSLLASPHPPSASFSSWVNSFTERALCTWGSLFAAVTASSYLFYLIPWRSEIPAFVCLACWFLSGFTLMLAEIPDDNQLEI